MAATTLLAGTPLWRKPITSGADSTQPNRDTQVIHPEETDATCTVFCGVVCREDEPIGWKVPVVSRGRAYARVKGPVSVGDSIGLSAGHLYLEKDGDPACGQAMAEIENTDTVLISVNLGGGGGGAGESLSVWL